MKGLKIMIYKLIKLFNQPVRKATPNHWSLISRHVHLVSSLVKAERIMAEVDVPTGIAELSQIN
jgi:hypothetical protein